MFKKILIANRGEIACRVIRTAHRMGIACVAVYSDADAAAQHVRQADEAVRLGPPPAAESYLRGEAILAAARRTGAEAIHPGYGFLSENAGFAEACAAAGLVFIGPPPAAIRAMGLKDQAKARMEAAGVPVVPGYHGADQDPALLAAEAERIGYPVLIKAVAGGGGKGMRRVDAAKDFATALEGARREARNAFGNDAVLVEKYVTAPRHIEVQVFADSQGNAVHLFERDCSLQRRHQKVVEEAPAPGMPDDMRARMGAAAVAAAQAVGYVGAGTVEFIADSAGGLDAEQFFFMEMNTRLQVEHPVTEAITGTDLVEWQLRVAAGEPLPAGQADLAIDGHAVEVRLYAEDAEHGFVPATGDLHVFALPGDSPGLRVDTGVAQGDTVSPHYDPMIAKLIAWGPDRRTALDRLGRALSGTAVLGVTTNGGFLRRLLADPGFRDGQFDTGLIDRNLPALLAPDPAEEARLAALAAGALLAHRAAADAARAARSADPWSPWGRSDGWRMNLPAEERLTLARGERETGLAVTHLAGGRWRLQDLAGGAPVELGWAPAGGSGGFSAVLDGHRQQGVALVLPGLVWLACGGVVRRFALVDPMQVEHLDEGAGGTLKAPMPGKIVKVLAKAGTAVAKGEALLVLEAMKMEHTIAAPGDGVIEAMPFAAGAQVQEGDVLVRFAEPDEAAA
ncbi:MAG: acetyl/propionyl/methylcrotonyl-CoA carboxylase subunit alpha [Sneathiellaceae bacterium]